MEAGSDDEESEEDDEAESDDEADDQEDDESEDQEDDESESDNQEDEELVTLPETNNLAEKKKNTDDIQKALLKAEKAERLAKLKA